MERYCIPWQLERLTSDSLTAVNITLQFTLAVKGKTESSAVWKHFKMELIQIFSVDYDWSFRAQKVVFGRARWYQHVIASYDWWHFNYRVIGCLKAASTHKQYFNFQFAKLRSLSSLERNISARSERFLTHFYALFWKAPESNSIRCCRRKQLCFYCLSSN